MSIRYLLIIGMLSVLVSAASAESEIDPRLTINPFAKPLVLLDSPKPTNKSATRIRLPRIDIKAVMLAGEDSMINTHGRIVKLGEKVKGATLVQVLENQVTFRYRGKLFTVKVN